MDWGLAKVLTSGGLADELPGETERETGSRRPGAAGPEPRPPAR